MGFRRGDALPGGHHERLVPADRPGPRPCRTVPALPRSHIALLLLVNALWGFNFVAAKGGTLAFGPLAFIALRFAIVLALLLPWLRVVPGHMREILAIGLVMGVGHYTFMFYAIWLAGSLSSVAVASQLSVPFATLLAIVWLGERIRLVRGLAIAASFGGVVVIAFAPVGGDQLTALALVTVAAAAMAVATIQMRRLRGVGTFALQAWIALVSTVSVGALAWLIERPGLDAFTGAPLVDWWAPVYSAVGATIIGHGAQYWLLQRHEVNAVAPFVTLATVFAIGFGVVLLDDPLTPRIVVGGLLTLAGVTVVAVRNASRAAPTTVRTPR